MHKATVPLRPRRRVYGTPLGEMRSARRGDGAELVGLRAYQRGDDPRRLDQRASARASLARADDVLLVREFYSEEAARVVLVLDRSPSMQLFPPGLPWLQKPVAVQEIVRLVNDSAADARSALGALVPDGAGELRWWPPIRRPRTHEWTDSATAASVSLADMLDRLGRQPRLGRGTFIFVVSDFLEPPDEEAWWRVLARGWDPVPVVVQDPVWEQSFPAVGGVPFKVAGGGVVHVSRREASSLRKEHETRFHSTVERLRALTLEPICIDAHDRLSIHAAFARWAAGRGGRVR